MVVRSGGAVSAWRRDLGVDGHRRPTREEHRGSGQRPAQRVDAVVHRLTMEAAVEALPDKNRAEFDWNFGDSSRRRWHALLRRWPARRKEEGKNEWSVSKRTTTVAAHGERTAEQRPYRERRSTFK